MHEDDQAPPALQEAEPAPAPAAPAEDPLAKRVHRALGPLAVGVILDLLDFGTFGVIGIYFGAIVGLAAGWYLGMMAGLGTRARVLFGIGAAIYLTLPMTELIPVATIIAATGRFLPRGATGTPAG